METEEVHKLEGYPFISQGGTYNQTFEIHGEAQKSNYKRMPNDDLSGIWRTNHRDNIDDLDIVLKTADVNAIEKYDTEFYGARGLDLVDADGEKAWCDQIGKKIIANKATDGEHRYVNMYANHQDEQAPDVEEIPEPEKCKTKSINWTMWIIILLVIFAALMYGSGGQKNNLFGSTG